MGGINHKKMVVYDIAIPTLVIISWIRFTTSASSQSLGALPLSTSSAPGPTQAERLWEATARGTASTGAPMWWRRWVRNLEMLSYIYSLRNQRLTTAQQVNTDVERYTYIDIDIDIDIIRYLCVHMKLNTFAWLFQPWLSETCDLGWSPFGISYGRTVIHHALRRTGIRQRIWQIARNSRTWKPTRDTGAQPLHSVQCWGCRRFNFCGDVSFYVFWTWIDSKSTPPFVSAMCLIRRTSCDPLCPSHVFGHKTSM